ncbi:MAG TPA: aldolase/citrate lyase family protein [Terriglobia bacterium]|nr:aldolase/citrate lyase family protein [Terriglobia bacterium]
MKASGKGAVVAGALIIAAAAALVIHLGGSQQPGPRTPGAAAGRGGAAGNGRGVPVEAATASAARGASSQALYNTAKAKLLAGKQIFSFTQSKFDIAGYCERAKHYDFTWFEMQHSTLTFGDVEKMIAACPRSAATPMIRLPDAQEWHIQHATDIGALGVIIPTVDDASRAREAAKWSRYPPVARRSAGGGQAASIWGSAYRQTFNDNMLVVVMIETVEGVDNTYDIASVPGIDVVLIGNNDLSSFSGFQQNDKRYQALVTKVHDETLRAGKIWGQANAKYASNHPLAKDAKFFQDGPAFDGWTPSAGRALNRTP